MSRLGVLALLSIALAGPPARAADLLVDLSAHGLLNGMGAGWGGGLDLGADAAWLPVPEVAIGLEADLAIPLRTVGDKSSDLLFRGGPVVWLRFGEDAAWGFVRAGLVAGGHYIADGLEPVLELTAGAGFVVAPRSLPFHFGFEVVGDFGIWGEVKTWGAGLGALVGWVL